jgi:hypothetical protein
MKVNCRTTCHFRLIWAVCAGNQYEYQFPVLISLTTTSTSFGKSANDGKSTGNNYRYFY